VTRFARAHPAPAGAAAGSPYVQPENRPLWNQQYVGGAGHDEASRPTVPVHGRFQCEKQSRHTLHLVKDGLVRQVSHEAHWIGLRRGKLHIVVEGDVGVARRIADHTGQGRFAALARPVHQDHRGVGQGLLKTAARKPRVEYLVSHGVHSKAYLSAK
jgi:hypothetical protein